MHRTIKSLGGKESVWLQLTLSPGNLTGEPLYGCLQEEDTAGDMYFRGQVRISLMVTETDRKKGKRRGTLSILVKQGKDLPKMAATGLTDAFVKCYLLPDRSNAGKRKTGVIKNNLNPVWEEKLAYESVDMEKLSTERVLEVTVWDFNKGSTNNFIGGLRLGPRPQRGGGKPKEWMDSIGDELSHWEEAMARPGEWVERWHTLRTTMDPRSVAH